MARHSLGRTLVLGGVAAAAFSLSGVASAQEEAPSAVPLSGSGASTLSATGTSAAAPQERVVVRYREAPKEEGGNDHDLFVHHIAVGYFGISQLPVGNGTAAGGTVNAPVIGLRYWATRMVGIDAGLGFGYANQSPGGNGASADQFGFAFHGGLPLALADSKHFSFEVVPIEGTFGFTGGSFPAGGVGGAAPSVSVNGFRMDVGARIGAELHFGFIGIPQLALEGSIGLYVEHRSWGTNAAANASTTTFSTSVGSDPWAIFTDTIAALYYF
jgi:hypothetical protein